MRARKDPAKGNGAILYDVTIRGTKLALGFFNRGADDFLFRRGYTIVWSGWDGELLPGKGRLLLRPPVATDKGKPIRGVVRYEMVADRPAETMSLSPREGHGRYPPTAQGEADGILSWSLPAT